MTGRRKRRERTEEEEGKGRKKEREGIFNGRGREEERVRSTRRLIQQGGRETRKKGEEKVDKLIGVMRCS